MGLFDRFKKSNKAEAKTTAPAPVTAVAKPKAAAKAKTTIQSKAVVTAPATVLTDILVRPIVTEKSTATGTYYFRVAKSASKNEIAKAFKGRFGKMPRKVNIVNVLGKTKARGRTVGKRADWKKAIIYLNKGETVDTSK